MAKDAVATMGGTLPNDTFGRDAVHVAVFSAFAAVRLLPGQDIAIIAQGDKDVEVAPIGETVALVDPFLKVAVQPGERFWAYLYPRTITALSHRWSHPALEQVATAYAPPGSVLASEAWIKDYAANLDLGYNRLMRGADDYIECGEYLCDGDTLEGEHTSPEFWRHYEIVRGKKVADPTAQFFTCSC